MNKLPNESICLVAILKDEEPFLDEWILYHKMIGIDHFYLYDDDPKTPLLRYLKPHKDYVTVIPWYGKSKDIPGRDRQTKAYWNAYQNYAFKYEWVCFIDGDEFIVLKKHENIKSFLSDYQTEGAISLNWHVFGHNGFYEDPKGLITSQLIRRMFMPNKNVKTITRTKLIAEICSAHFCRMKAGLRVDANKRSFLEELYPGKTDIAHINHYQCRSFKRWMNRVKRGVPCIDDLNSAPKNDLWRINEEECLKQFVTTVALNKNEYIDEYMLKYKIPLENAISQLKRK